jgi:hypothetical protein
MNIADPCLVAIVNDIHDGSAEAAAAKLMRLWTWPRVLETLIFGLKLDSKDYADLQITYVEHGLSTAFFTALDLAIVAANVYRQKDEKRNISYRSLSVEFRRVLSATLQNYPDVMLSDSEIAMLELDYLSLDSHDETTLRETLVSKVKKSGLTHKL